MNDYSDFIDAASDSTALAELAELVAQLAEAEQAMYDAEDNLRRAKQRVRQISEMQIPEVMDRVGVREFVTKTGAKISVKESIRCSVPAAKRAEAWQWLRDNGHGSLVKSTVSVSFGKEQIQDAELFRRQCEEQGMLVKSEEKVEPATLKKFIKDSLDSGTDIPMELFGAYNQKQTKVTGQGGSVFGE
jgi:hypothetical protein